MLRLAIVVCCAAGLATAACRRGEAPPAPSPVLPFTDRAVEDRDFAMTSVAGETLVFRATDVGGGQVRLARYRRAGGLRDSIAAVVDAAGKRPVSSYQHLTTGGGVVTGAIAYGEGYQGQALLTVTTPAGRMSDNLRTPEPYLDAAQLPQTLAALDFSRPDTIHFNYVSPFENVATSALLTVGRLDTLRLAQGPAPAWRVHLKVSGLEETYWFAAPPGGYRLLRWRDERRRVTWDRLPPR